MAAQIHRQRYQTGQCSCFLPEVQPAALHLSVKKIQRHQRSCLMSMPPLLVTATYKDAGVMLMKRHENAQRHRQVVTVGDELVKHPAN
jgi:hypothetical protein